MALVSAEAERERKVAEIAELAPPAPAAVTLHPGSLAARRRALESLADVTRYGDAPAREEAARLLRCVIAAVEVTPGADRRDRPQILLRGVLAELLGENKAGALGAVTPEILAEGRRFIQQSMFRWR